MNKRIEKQTVHPENKVYISSSASVCGSKEKCGPIGDTFDICITDDRWNESTWEKAESKMQREAVKLAVQKSNLKLSDINYIFAGDLMNQCIGAGFGLRDFKIPFFGIYGACSTMIEGISLAAMTIDAGYAQHAVAVTSSHFCTAERQYRTPLAYGGQRTPTAQWTVTGAGAAVLSDNGNGPYISEITTGKICDMGIKDANNMGAAMAPAAYDTLLTHFTDCKRTPHDYDLIITGDLGKLGKEIIIDLISADGYDISANYEDCGCMIYDINGQDVHSGGSGCGCIASVLCGCILKKLREKKLNRVLAIGTGALLSPTSTLQGESVPAIAHAIVIENEQKVSF